MVQTSINRNLTVSISIIVFLAVALNVIVIVSINVTDFSRTTENIIDTTMALINGEDISKVVTGNSASENGGSGKDGVNSVVKQTYDDSNAAIEGTTYWIDEETSIIAIDPSGGGKAVTSEHQIAISGIGFEYEDHNSFVLVPDDGVPSMVLIFDKGSIKSTLYMDNDALKLLDDPDSRIEIAGTGSMKVDKSDVRKVEDLGLYVVEVRNREGGTNLELELMSGNRVIYPLISTGKSEIIGSKVMVSEYTDIRFFEIRSISDLFLWLNLKFNMNLNNKEKKILQKGILETLEETVEANSRYVSGEPRI